MMSFQYITTVFVHPIWRIRPATKPIFQGTHSETNPPPPPHTFLFRGNALQYPRRCYECKEEHKAC